MRNVCHESVAIRVFIIGVVLLFMEAALEACIFMVWGVVLYSDWFKHTRKRD